MRRYSSWLLGGLASLSLLVLASCVEKTTSSSSATAPTDGAPTPTTTAVTPPVVTVPTVPPTASAPTTVPGATPAATSLVGTWESAACGARTYPRQITFVDATTFTAEDLVSPCPKGVACIWSGIITRSGTYTTAKDLVTFTVIKAGSGPAKTQFPESLTLDASGAPVELGSDGKACAYKHAAATREP